jgi:hypothetical protein
MKGAYGLTEQEGRRLEREVGRPFLPMACRAWQALASVLLRLRSKGTVAQLPS